MLMMQAITRPNKKQESLTKSAVYVHLDRLPSQHAFPKYTINIEKTLAISKRWWCKLWPIIKINDNVRCKFITTDQAYPNICTAITIFHDKTRQNGSIISKQHDASYHVIYRINGNYRQKTLSIYMLTFACTTRRSSILDKTRGFSRILRYKV